MIRTEEKQSFAHYGTPRHSGRYPWGSGSPESTRNRDFLDSVKMLKKDGMSEPKIAEGMGLTTTQLRAKQSLASSQLRSEKITTAQRLKETGMSNGAIAERMNLPGESSVRALLAPGAKDKADATQTTANMLKNEVSKKDMIDIGKGVEHQVGVTRNRLDTAVASLREEGYTTHSIWIQQVGNVGKFTEMKVLAKPGTDPKFIDENRKDIKQITERSGDYGRSFFGVQPPISVSERRVGINYKENDGEKADGLIYIRPGVKDLSLGNSNYAQVRIQVGQTHYLKGMAVYKDDLPEGKDIVFNTKKTKAEGWKSESNRITDDPDLPFGAIINQYHDEKGKVSSALNKVGSPTKEGAGEEGSWDTWSKNLSSQMLSKQKPDLAKQQLDLTFDRRVRELNEINSLTNPTVRKELLLKFADSTDSAAVHLKAAGLPRQATKVLLPIASMKPGEVHAPTFNNGDRVALIRYPHGGTFEIPQLVVNNRNREARKIIGANAEDAIGIHHSVAKRLSGADFDGDTVLVIPNNKGAIKSTAALEGLKDFDPHMYKLSDDSPIPRISSSQKQDEMGKISNLITDMTIGGADGEKLARAIKHSMVVIDSEKHHLNYRLSEKDNAILSLKEEYQGGKRKGASTLISRAGAAEFVPHRVERAPRHGGPFDPATGKRVYEPTHKQVPDYRMRKDPITGKKVKVQVGTKDRKIESKKLAEVDDAHRLVSANKTRIELIYADHSNRLKAMANSARKEALPLKGTTQSDSAKVVYKEEAASLTAKLKNAERNAPYERQAQLLANVQVSQKRQAHPHMEKEEVKKVKQQALNDARNRTGAKKHKIDITQREWDAIQAGAISDSKLKRILTNSDMDTVKALALPKHIIKMSPSKMQLANTMLSNGYTQAEVADRLGVGVTTLKVALSA